MLPQNELLSPPWWQPASGLWSSTMLHHGNTEAVMGCKLIAMTVTSGIFPRKLQGLNYLLGMDVEQL